MIGRISGTLLEKAPPSLLVDAGGVGYEIDAPMSTFYTLPQTGEQVALHTHLVVREDAQLLYGFTTKIERTLFKELLKVSGVGAKVALSILSGLSVDDFLASIDNKDVDTLVRVPGIGKKTAERLVVEMHDRVAKLNVGSLPGMASSGQLSSSGRAQAEEALAALGYKPAETKRLLDKVPDEGQSVEELIRAALRLAAN
jgi:Holliday junction DNA helicase RuvA